MSGEHPDKEKCGEALPPVLPAEQAAIARDIVRSIHLPIVIVTSEGVVVAANPAFSQFCELGEELAGRPLRQVAPMLATNELFAHALQRVSETGTPLGDIDLTMDEDGEFRSLRLTARPLDLQPELILITIEDVTRQRQLASQLLTAQRLETVGRLAGGVAHDFNNVLTVIQSFATFLVEPTYESERDVGEIGRVILESAERAAKLTSQLLAFGRQQVQELRLFDLNEPLGHLREMLLRLAGPDVRLAFDFSAEPLIVRADLTQIEQIILNLVINARDAMPEGGTITLTTAFVPSDAPLAATSPAVSDWAMLAVSDTGIGMDAATKARLFEPFFTTKPFGQATGLGLSTVYGSVAQTGGFVTVESDLGAGSTFRVFLPRQGQREHKEAPRAEQRAISVLLVEDDHLVREATERILKRHGFAVTVARNGAQALKLLNEMEGSVDVVVTDVAMPEMNGPALVRHLLQLPAHRDLRVVFTSGYAEESVLDRDAFGEGTVYLQKPFVPRALVDAIRSVLL